MQIGVTPVVKFEWDHNYYSGSLVAVHASLDFVAYALKGRLFCCRKPSSRLAVMDRATCFLLHKDLTLQV